MRFIPLEKLIDTHDSYRRVFKVDGQHILLLKQGEDFFAVDARCPHQEQDLAFGELNGTILTCPKHQYRFDINTGANLVGLPDCALRCYSVAFEGRYVGITLPSD
jgi:nitrite reductase/ring-hydroxylating ferredoxin subunit